MPHPARFPHPARRTSPSPPRALDITWTRTWDTTEPRERYRILYVDSAGQQSTRTIELLRIGHTPAAPGRDEQPYLGVHDLTDAGKFKSLRADRVLAVLEQLTPGHPPSLRAYPTYATTLPPFPLPGAVFRVPQTANRSRTWTVDLNAYTCSCPERRPRALAGYNPGQLGMVCLHIARAILDHLPKTKDSGADLPLNESRSPLNNSRSPLNNSGPISCVWTPELLSFLQDRRKLHLDNLT